MRDIKRIAIVGFTNSPFDRNIILEAIIRLAAIKFTTTKGVQVEVFDLSIDRDFLVNADQFDLVLLIHIFSDQAPPNSERQALDHLFENECRVSDRHHPDVWKDRFLETNAKVILVFGDTHTCLGSSQIGPLTGYRLVRSVFGNEEMKFFTDVYIKE